MEGLKTFVENNNYEIILAVFLSMLGIIVGVILHFKSKKRKALFYSKASINIFSNKKQLIKDIKILYRDEKIENLTTTTVAIWNGGNETIDYSDLAPSNKLKILSREGIVFYDYDFVYRSEPTNKIDFPDSMLVEEVDNQIHLKFDYIDKKQGCIIKIIHSGKNSDDIIVTGTVKGFGKIRQRNNIESTQEVTEGLNYKHKIYHPNFRLKGLIFISMSILLYFLIPETEKIAKDVNVIFANILSAIIMIYGILLLFTTDTMPRNIIKHLRDN